MGRLNYKLRNPLLENSIHLISTTFFTTLLGFVFWLIIARFYTSEQVGLASTIISSMNLLVMFSIFGFNIALIRFLPDSNNEADLVNSCFNLSLIATIAISIIFLLGLDIWSPKLLFLKDGFLFEVLFIGFSAIWTITTLMNSIFIAKRVSVYVLSKECIFGLSKILIPIFLIPYGAFGIYIAWGIGSLVALFYGIVNLLRVLPKYMPRLLLNLDIIRKMIHFSFWSYIATLFNVMPSMILPTIVTTLASAEIAAYFYISWMIANLLFSIPSQVAQSLLAEGSNMAGKLEDNIINSTKFILILLIPAIIIIFMEGDKLLLLFGKSYSVQGPELLRALSISALPFGCNSIYVSIKRIQKKMYMVVLVYGIIAIFTLVGSYLFLKQLGLICVGYAWILGNLIANALIFMEIISNKDYLKKMLCRLTI